MEATRKSYPSDVSDAEWELLVPFLTLMREDAPQREHPLRDLFNAMRYVVRTGCQWRYVPHDFPPWTAVYQQARRWFDAGVFETISHELRVIVRIIEDRQSQPSGVIFDGRTMQSTPERGQVQELAARVQAVTGDHVEIAFADQGYTGDEPEAAASDHGIELVVVKHHQAKRGFLLLPRRWVVERTFGWLGRFRRLARDYERLTATLKGWHWLASLVLLLAKAGIQSQ